MLVLPKHPNPNTRGARSNEVPSSDSDPHGDHRESAHALLDLVGWLL